MVEITRVIKMLYDDVTIISLLLRIIEGFAQVFLLSAILKKKMSLKEYILSAVIIVSLYELVTLIIPANYNYKFITIFLIIVPVVSLVCKIKIYKVFLAYSIAILVIALIDMISGIVFFKLFEAESFEEITGWKYYVGMLTVDLLIFISGLTIKYFKTTYTNIENDIKNFGIAFNSLLTLLFIFPSIIIIISYLEDKPLEMETIIISLISMLAIVVLSIFNSQKRYNLIISEKNLEKEKNYNVMLESLVDSLRTFKHDYNNTLSTLYGYVQLGDMESLKRMFKEILEESRQISSLDKLNPNLIKDPNIFGILTAKYQECIKKNIIMNIEIYAEIEEIDIKMYDLTRILGIFLDNAIEAAAGSQERKINLTINERNNQLIIEISNTYKEGQIETIEKLFEKGISSKGKNRGLGLYKVKEIIKKYSGVELKTTKNTKIFMQKLIIQKHM